MCLYLTHLLTEGIRIYILHATGIVWKMVTNRRQAGVTRVLYFAQFLSVGPESFTVFLCVYLTHLLTEGIRIYILHATGIVWKMVTNRRQAGVTRVLYFAVYNTNLKFNHYLSSIMFLFYSQHTIH